MSVVIEFGMARQILIKNALSVLSALKLAPKFSVETDGDSATNALVNSSFGMLLSLFPERLNELSSVIFINANCSSFAGKWRSSLYPRFKVATDEGSLDNAVENALSRNKPRLLKLKSNSMIESSAANAACSVSPEL